jgi:hypothetical protein
MNGFPPYMQQLLSRQKNKELCHAEGSKWYNEPWVCQGVFVSPEPMALLIDLVYF